MLKISACLDGKFTCSNGDCVNMDQRCDQVQDCSDDSDEVNCETLVLKEGYRQSAPPVPVSVKISFDVLDIAAIREADNEIDIKFSVKLEWNERRATYHNLKIEVTQNALEQEKIDQIWIPKLIYRNNRDNYHTRFAVSESSIFIRREGNFTRSDLSYIDETEVFKGKENTIEMTQTHTKDFQCQYQLQHFPFDTQV